MPGFERVHHQRIAALLGSLDSELLRADQCWFGGGTAIVLTHDEYRESLDLDFMVSDQSGYRDLRQRLVGARNLESVTRSGREPIVLEREARAASKEPAQSWPNCHNRTRADTDPATPARAFTRLRRRVDGCLYNRLRFEVSRYQGLIGTLATGRSAVNTVYPARKSNKC